MGSSTLSLFMYWFNKQNMLQQSPSHCSLATPHLPQSVVEKLNTTPHSWLATATLWPYAGWVSIALDLVAYVGTLLCG